MEVLSIGEIAGASGGRLINSGGDLKIAGVSIDSRRINPGDIFIAIKGSNFDGHDFINEAAEKGAVAVVAQRKPYDSNLPCILVEDTLKALQNIARHYRNKFRIPFIAVTGSSGKTTTKDMIASVLSRRFRVLKTEGNLNNAIGLPLMLLKLKYGHDIAVLEMGMNSLGEIRLLSDIVRQNIGVITNVGNAHIEMLGSMENILKAKLEIFTYFGSEDIAVINGDNEMLAGFTPGDYMVVRFGMGEGNDVYAYGVEEKGKDGISFNVDLYGRQERFDLTLPGIHNVYNALSAIAVAKLFKMDAEDIREGLRSFKPSKMRMEIINLSSGIRIINDVYNANPDSMKAAINVLQSMKSGSRSVCIFADMLELGDISEQEHYNIGRYAAAAGVDVLVAAGNFSSAVKRGAEAAGMDSRNTYAFRTKEEAVPRLGEILKPGDVVLVKGSRSMKMEYIIDFLRERG